MTSPDKKRGLEIGPGLQPLAHNVFPLEEWDIEYITAADDEINLHPMVPRDKVYLGDVRRLDKTMEDVEKYDGIFASHVLEHFPWWDTQNVLESWVAMLKPGGEFHVVVPSLEWCARQILSEHPSPALKAAIYGGCVDKWDGHMTGFTMRELRVRIEALGVEVGKAVSGDDRIIYVLDHYDGDKPVKKGYPTDELYVAGWYNPDGALDRPPPKKE